MDRDKYDYRKGLALTAVGGLALTVDIPLIRLSNGDAWSILLLRSAVTFAAAIVGWAVWRTLRSDAPSLIPGKLGFLVAALYGLGSVAFMLAVFMTSTANLVFILAFNTMFAALLSWLFLNERPHRITVMTMIVMVGAVLLIVGDGVGSGNWLGDLLALASAFLIAAAITATRASGRDMGFTALVGVALPFVVAALMTAQVGYRIDSPWWIVFNGAVVMPLSFFCLAAGPKYISAPEVAMFYLLETVLAPVWMWMIFAEVPTRNSMVGGSILVTALVGHSIWQWLESRNPDLQSAGR